MVSQNNEAEVIIKYFNGKVGNLLSLGENDGMTLSNSYDLIQLGWGADLFEPVLECYAKICNLHKENQRVFAHPYGIHEKTGKQTFYLTDDTLVASLNKELAASWGGKFKMVYLDFLSVEDMLLECVNKKFDFITIDCEGSDLAILESLDLAKLGCECICLEHGNSEPNYNRMKEICNSFGLKKELLRNFENVIFAI
jgi:FkbM family methyltransferase